MTPYDLQNRLDAALSKYTKARGYTLDATPYQTPQETTREIVRREGLEKFFAQVDRAKSLLVEVTPELTPLRKHQDTTSLRVRMERVMPGYFGKTHLSVALVEMGFAVAFISPNYFTSNFRSRAAFNAIGAGY